MGWGQWEWDRARAAEEFLSTGVDNLGVASDYGSLLGTTDSTNCFQSSECGSGFACVNGECVSVSGGNTTNGGSGSTAGPGTGCDPDDPLSPCGKNTGGSACDIPGCGQNDNPSAEDCCGDRTCRFDGDGVVCACDDGEFPGSGKCNSFCAEYKAANGEHAAGCSDSSTCDECSSCLGGSCVPSSDAPCWCDAGSSCGDCETCSTDEGGAGFGQCSSAGCTECSTIYNYQCPCNVVLPSVKACRNSNSNGLAAPYLAQQLGAERCRIACQGADGGEIDPCAGNCESKAYCTDTTGPQGPCPPYTTCTDNGSMTVGDVTCTFRTECSKQNLPPQCQQCDCNCNNDCPNCQLCGPGGTCYPDPLCDNQCPEGQVYNSATQRCEEQECAPGYILNPNTGQCELGGLIAYYYVYTTIVLGYCPEVGSNYMERQTWERAGNADAGSYRITEWEYQGTQPFSGPNGVVFDAYYYAPIMTTFDSFTGGVLYSGKGNTVRTNGGPPTVVQQNSTSGDACFTTSDQCMEPENVCVPLQGD